MFKASHKLRMKEWGNICPFWSAELPSPWQRPRMLRGVKDRSLSCGKSIPMLVDDMVGIIFFISSKGNYMYLWRFKYILASV